MWLCDSITKLAEVFFPLDKCKPTSPLDFFGNLCRLCKSGARFVRSQGVTPLVDSWRLYFAFWHWASAATTPPRPGLSDWLRIFHQRPAWALHLLRHLSQQIKECCCWELDTKRFYWAVKRLKKFRPKPLRGVFLEDGELAKSPEEVAARWQRHFSSAIAGTPVSLEDISRLRRRSSRPCY